MTRLLFVAVAVLAALVATASPARAADPRGVDRLPPITDAQLAASVVPIEPAVTDITLSVSDLEATKQEAGRTVVTLVSDILFAFDSATMPAGAASRIAEAVKGAPRGARVQVLGFTDRIGSDAHNLELSRARAQAVADALTASRPDLQLAVEGRGKADPVADNGTPEQDNPEGRALNRRVEIRFGG